MEKSFGEYFKLQSKKYDDKCLKKCLFCGEKPVSKTKEHVIPKWLIEYTGEVKRIINIREVDVKNKVFGFKKIPFDQFVFPACDKCNTDFANLEGKAKKALIDLISNKAISCSSAEILLDWFDKIRVGMWISALTWCKNPLGIIPKFGISTRLGAIDRILYIASCDDAPLGVNFSDMADPVFHSIPSLITVRINNFFFTSISSLSLCAASLGLPKVKILKIPDSKSFEFEADVKINSLLKKTWRENWPAAPKKNVILAQAIYHKSLSLDGYLRDSDVDRMLNKNKSKPHVYENGKLDYLRNNKRILNLQTYPNLELLYNSSSKLHLKLRKYIVKNLPNYQEKHTRVWKNMLSKFVD